jgi:alpha-N-acetylglucosaminidase
VVAVIKEHIMIRGILCALWLAAAAGAATPGEEAVAGLARRVVGQAADGFRFEQIAAEQGADVFELASEGGQVVVRGDSALSMAVGLNWYLKHVAHCHVSLNGRQVALPRPLPLVPEAVRRSAWAPARYFLNYCAFGYSLPWWDWPEWEGFIDWMALQGINQPLSVTGQEAVWQAVGRRFGLTESDLDAYLAGPPYLPFQWMGCLDGHGGPLPANWPARRAALQQKIVARERELGMRPVLQGFTGHVPEALLKKFPTAKAQHIRWIEWNTWMLDPTDPLFPQIGAAFLEEQAKLFGTDHLYAADSFIEMKPPSGDLQYLAKLGRAIYEGMAETDPQAVWLLQGWTFFHGRSFWSNDRIKAFLDAVPNEGMQILDLFCEKTPVWNQTEGFFGKPWVWSFVYNFGNNTVLGGSGPLARVNDLPAVRAHAHGQNLRGVGLVVEGLGHNPPVYDLMFEQGWQTGVVDQAAWMRTFSHYRYGHENADAAAAWDILLREIYTGHRNTESRTIVTSYPGLDRRFGRNPAGALAKAWQRLIQAGAQVGGTETYQHDLVNVGRQYLAEQAGTRYDQAVAAQRAGDAARFRSATQAFLATLGDLDHLLAADRHFLLGRWLADAKRWGETDAERAKMEWNARRVLTLWGQGTPLRDYAWKEWAGLVDGFYAKRWELFFRRQAEALDAGQPFDQTACHAELLRFENAWSAGRESYAATPQGDPLAIARRLYAKYAPQPIAHLALDKPATCSRALPGMDAARANDGLVETESYWGTDVAEDPGAWWQVDLETPTPVGRVAVVGYFGDVRSYGFTVEGSLDGKSWDLLADRRDNKEPATKDGYVCAFAPRPVRYLRVTLTANSANTGRHLVEVMVYGK